jgi:hypothetical protein
VSDRSDELRRQRELLREHLAWIDREIAAAEGLPPQIARTPEPPVRIVAPIYTAPDPVDPRDAEAILAQFRQDTSSIASSTKRGCMLYAVAALGVLALIVTLVYFYAASHRGP